MIAVLVSFLAGVFVGAVGYFLYDAYSASRW